MRPARPRGVCLQCWVRTRPHPVAAEARFGLMKSARAIGDEPGSIL
jgi:hypothetical protein